MSAPAPTPGERSPHRVDMHETLVAALAALAASGAAAAIGLPQAVWAVVSAVVVAEATLSGTAERSRDRFLATLIGCATGIAVASAAGSDWWSVGIAVGLALPAAGLAGLGTATRLAGASAAMVSLTGGANPYGTGVARFLDVVVGSLAAVAVTALTERRVVSWGSGRLRRLSRRPASP